MFKLLDVGSWEFSDTCASLWSHDTNRSWQDKFSYDAAAALIRATMTGQFLWVVRMEMAHRYVGASSASDPLGQRGADVPVLTCTFAKYDGNGIFLELTDYAGKLHTKELPSPVTIPDEIRAALARTLVEYTAK